MTTAFAVVGCLLFAVLVPAVALGGAALYATTRARPAVAPAPGPTEPAAVEQDEPRRGRRRRDR